VVYIIKKQNEQRISPLNGNSSNALALIRVSREFNSNEIETIIAITHIEHDNRLRDPDPYNGKKIVARRADDESI
jgi:hypothetical protein